MAMQKIRILLADDHTILRKALREIIEKQCDMTVVGEARDGVEAMEKAEELAPDVILMDIRMPILDGVKAIRLIRAQDKHVGIVVLTMFNNEQLVFEAIKAGAQGYILKDAELDELLEAIRGVQRGDPMIDSSIAGRVLVEFCNLTRKQKSRDFLDLSERETEILQLVAQGATNKEIAEMLFVSEYTVRNALSIIFQKLHVNNRTEAAVHALQEGLLNIE
jgi:NarL family two-component system response regulator LiaR